MVNDQRLVAYLTGRATPTAELRDHLAAELPDYMIPAAFVFLDALPLTPNYKVDRKTLRGTPVAVAAAGPDHTPTRTATERDIAALWSEILRVGSVGIHDRFDTLGGDSLQFALMITRLGKSLQLDLPVRMDDEMMTVAGLAKGLESFVSVAAPQPAPARRWTRPRVRFQRAPLRCAVCLRLRPPPQPGTFPQTLRRRFRCRQWNRSPPHRARRPLPLRHPRS